MDKKYASILKSAIKEDATLAQKEAFKELINKEIEYDERISEIESLKSTLKKKDVELAEVRGRIEAERIEANLQVEAFKKQFEKYQNIESEFKTLQERIVTSYSKEDLSSYLNEMISEFNENTYSDNDYVKYVINSMDVDLKVHLYGDEDKNLCFTAPDITETEKGSLSSIKISIQAVPN